MSGPFNPALVQQIQDLMNVWNTHQAQLGSWLGGTTNGGPNSDGRYPLVDAQGRATLVPSPAAFSDMVSGPANFAELAKVAAELARDDALASADRAEAERILSEAARGASVDARNLAQEHRNHAGTHEANARYWAELAQGSGQSASEDRVIVEQLAAETAANAALAAQDAQDAAASAALAATFDPALFDRKTDLLPADRITGVLSVDRIPVLPSQRQFASSGGLANLTTVQQNEIGQGSIVTTTDGFRYVYTGSGSKTLASSYVVLADTTPEWTSISGRPSEFTPAAHTQDWSTITGKPPAFTANRLVAADPNIGTGGAWISDRLWIAHSGSAHQVWDSLSFSPNSKADIDGANTFTANQTFRGLIPLRVQQSASTGAGFVDLAGVSANSSGSIVFRDAAGTRLGYIGNANATTLNIVADVANIALNRRPAFAGNLAWDAGNFDPSWKLDCAVGRWVNTFDGKPRFYFQDGGRTFIRGHAGIEFRNTADGITFRVEEDGSAVTTGVTHAQGGIEIRNVSPTITFRDTNHRSAFIHVNENKFYVLRGSGIDSPNWASTGAGWPLEIDLETNHARFGGSIRTDVAFYVGGARQPIFTISQTAPSGGTDGDVHIVW